jgi:YD repeat-containing protein
VQEPFNLSLTYTYDAADNRTGVQDNEGGLATLTYDAANRPTNLKFTGNSATISYDLSWTARNQLSGITRYSDITGTTKIGTTTFSYDGNANLRFVHVPDSRAIGTARYPCMVPKDDYHAESSAR